MGQLIDCHTQYAAVNDCQQIDRQRRRIVLYHRINPGGHAGHAGHQRRRIAPRRRRCRLLHAQPLNQLRRIKTAAAGAAAVLGADLLGIKGLQRQRQLPPHCRPLRLAVPGSHHSCPARAGPVRDLPAADWLAAV